MRARLAIAVAAASFVAWSGCLEAPAPSADSHEAMEHDHALPEISLAASKCIQAGGNSVYAMEDGKTKIGPFFAADQNPEVGDPKIGAFGRPVTGPSNGIWHSAVICDSYDYEGAAKKTFHMGWVGQMIKKPDFDTSDARLHFFIADLSFSETPFVDELEKTTGGAMISPVTDMKIDFLVPEKFMHVIISEARHGTFEFTAELHKEFGKTQSQKIRFWMLVANDGTHTHEGGADATQYYPIAIDVVDVADGTGKKLAGESIGTFTHLPDGHYGNPLGHVWTGFSRTVSLGGIYKDVLYDETWLH